MAGQLNVALVGTGFMGKIHALAYRNARAVFGDLPEIVLHTLCDVPADRARAMADQFGFARATDDWRQAIADPEIDVVSVTTPNNLHRDLAVAALEAGKHVYCEKPLAVTLADAKAMAAAAAASSGKTMVGYNYLKNPAYLHARRLVAEGAIGRLVHFRGWVDEDYQADPDLAWTWRAKRADAGLGVLSDLGCHIVSLACGLVGPVESLTGETQIVHATRPLADGSGRAEVENEDTASALIRFAGGVHGTISASRSAWGRKNRLDWELHGTEGMLTFEQERMNELHLYRNRGPAAEQGFATILTGPEHPPYEAFCPAPGHQLGVGDLKTIEAASFLRHVAGGEPARPNFADALAFEQVIHAIDRSAATGERVRPGDL